MERIKTDICIIGGGSGGLTTAAGASQMGADVVLIEGGKMGGDCLNYGCVPSKALIAAGKHAKTARKGPVFGVNSSVDSVDFQRVHDHVREVIGTIEPLDSPERFESLGCKVILEYGRFTGPREVTAGNHVIEAKWFIIATGSTASVPPIPGLDEVDYFTNETLFDNTELPEHLMIIGGGPIGSEMAQAHRRLGAEVTILDGRMVLGRDDQELAGIVKARFREEGINLREGVRIASVKKGEGGKGVIIVFEDGEELAGSHLLVATGRVTNIDKLDLAQGGIDFNNKGVIVNDRLQSVSNKRVFAVGDVAGGLQFTHLAGYHGGIAIRNILFRLPAKASSPVPWVTYTDPEIAHVGMNEEQAREKHGAAINVLRWPFAENDRAQAERETDGLVKITTTSRGKVLGASIVGPHAGDLIQPWIIAVGTGMKIGKLAGFIAPYPTLGEVSKRAAGSYYTPKLFNDRTRGIVQFLMRFA